MAAETEAIKSFLVSLGFAVDQAGLKKFTGALSGTTSGALTAGKAVIGIATAAQAMVAIFAAQMERLYYTSKRTNASVENLQGLELGFKNIGLAGGAALQAVENMQAALRTNPGLRGVLDGIVGHSTEGLDQVEVFLDAIKGLKDLPHQLGAARIAPFGIDESTFFQVKKFLPELEAAYAKQKEINRNAGVDADAAAKALTEYDRQLNEIFAKIKTVGLKWSVELLPIFEKFNTLISDACDRLAKVQISPALDKIFKVIEKIDGGFGGFGKVLSGDVSGGVGDLVRNSPGGIVLNKLLGPGTDHRTSEGKIGGGPVGNNSREGRRLSEGKISGGSVDNAVGPASVTLGDSGIPTAGGWDAINAANRATQGSRNAERLRVLKQELAAETNPDNIAALKREIANTLRQYGGNLQSAATAYSDGPGAFERRGGLGGRLPQGPSGTAPGTAGGSTPAIQQKVDIHINTTDPQAAGRAAARELARVNADLLRNNKGAVQ